MSRKQQLSKLRCGIPQRNHNGKQPHGHARGTFIDPALARKGGVIPPTGIARPFSDIPPSESFFAFAPHILAHPPTLYGGHPPFLFSQESSLGLLRRRDKMLFAGRNLKLEIEYDGSNYCGWQVQKSHKVAKSVRKPPRRGQGHRKSIQETIEKALRKVLQEKIRLVASGRTDRGVHAKAQVANFLTNSDITLKKLQKALNGILPEDIAITKAEEVSVDFHSRFNAKSKVYRYTILNRNYPSALLRNQVYFFPRPLNIKLMRRESQLLLGKHDFKSFQASDKKKRDSIRTIKKLRTTKDKDLIYIDIEADGFLYNMVRNIVGTLIDIGRGRFNEGYLKKLLYSKNRKLAGPTAPARGLCLLEVKFAH